MRPPADPESSFVDLVNQFTDPGRSKGLASIPDLADDARVEAVRRFNQFYTGRLGLLKKGYLNSALSLAEIRVLYEIAHRDGATASAIGRDLELDAGYLSRMLAAFARRGLIRKGALG